MFFNSLITDANKNNTKIQKLSTVRKEWQNVFYIYLVNIKSYPWPVCFKIGIKYGLVSF